ncbi:ATP-binding protein [Streptomyces sp. bgisy100]|uniref:ATP-binding protein n=1 Tax=Streptomyces sp. bgisy100 TaxID=3413783 RepID=UPI003D724DB0
MQILHKSCPAPAGIDRAAAGSRFVEWTHFTLETHMESHHCTFTLPGTASAVASARRQVLADLCEWGLRPGSDVLHTIELAASELITNAVKHSYAEPVSVAVRLQGDTVRIDVCDSSPDLPKRRCPTAADENGRGLLIVMAMATRYAVEPTSTGKRCWAEFTIPPDALTAVPSSRSAAVSRTEPGRCSQEWRLPRLPGLCATAHIPDHPNTARAGD